MNEFIDGITSQNINSEKIGAGAKWIHRFMKKKKNRLTLKKAEMISTCRFSNTSNPFNVYDFYDIFEKLCFINSTFLEYL